MDRRYRVPPDAGRGASRCVSARRIKGCRRDGRHPQWRRGALQPSAPDDDRIAARGVPPHRKDGVGGVGGGPPGQRSLVARPRGVVRDCAWAKCVGRRILPRRTASSPASISRCVPVPAHERHDHHGDENQDNRNDDQQLHEIARIRRDRIRTTQDHWLKLSTSFKRDERVRRRRHRPWSCCDEPPRSGDQRSGLCSTQVPAIEAAQRSRGGLSELRFRFDGELVDEQTERAGKAGGRDPRLPTSRSRRGTGPQRKSPPVWSSLRKRVASCSSSRPTTSCARAMRIGAGR